MQLEHARELKNQLAAGMEKLLGVEHLTARSFSIAASSMEAVDPVQPTIAFGIARRHHDTYVVAVRVQRRELLHGPHIRALEERTHKELDVRYIGLVRPLQGTDLRRRVRPLQPGVSVGHFQVTAGTLGAFVRDALGKTFLLSNNHVIGYTNRGAAGDAITQPGRFDRGRKDRDRVAGLARTIRLRKTGPNRVDCAVAKLDDGVDFDLDRFTRLVVPPTIDPALEGKEVWKIGRTTSLRRGRVVTTELDNVVLGYEGLGNIRFDGQIELESAENRPFAEPGDSGSLVVTDEGQAIGLLVGGEDIGAGNGHGLVYANSIPEVLTALEVELVT